MEYFWDMKLSDSLLLWSLTWAIRKGAGWCQWPRSCSLCAGWIFNYMICKKSSFHLTPHTDIFYLLLFSWQEAVASFSGCKHLCVFHLHWRRHVGRDYYTINHIWAKSSYDQNLIQLPPFMIPKIFLHLQTNPYVVWEQSWDFYYIEHGIYSSFTFQWDSNGDSFINFYFLCSAFLDPPMGNKILYIMRFKKPLSLLVLSRDSCIKPVSVVIESFPWSDLMVTLFISITFHANHFY